MNPRLLLIPLLLVGIGCSAASSRLPEGEQCQNPSEHEERVAEILKTMINRMEEWQSDSQKLNARVKLLEERSDRPQERDCLRTEHESTPPNDCLLVYSFLARWSGSPCGAPGGCWPKLGDRVDVYQLAEQERRKLLVYKSAILLGFQAQPNDPSDPNSSVAVLVANAEKARLEEALTKLRNLILTPSASSDNQTHHQDSRPVSK